MGLNRKNCPNCGKFIRENSSFCIHCGMQLKEIVIEEESLECSKDLKEKAEVASAALNNINLLQEGNEDDYYEEKLEDGDEDNNVDVDIAGDEKTEDDVKDDDNTFAAILGKTSKEDMESTSASESNNASVNNPQNIKMLKAFSDKVKMQKASGGLFRQKESKVNTTKVEKKDKENDDEKKQTYNEADEYDPNNDRYYDNITAVVDARIEHIPKENIISTIFLALAFLVLVIFMIYFLVL